MGSMVRFTVFLRIERSGRGRSEEILSPLLDSAVSLSLEVVVRFLISTIF